jgi:hypothetical protein
MNDSQNIPGFRFIRPSNISSISGAASASG